MTDENTSSSPLSVGSKAPGFSLPSRSGATVSLGDFAGKSDVLVYFYPKDDTPGCTKQACSLRDAWKELSAADIVVLGISRDGAAAHNAFAAKYSLPFELLTDSDHAVHAAYGSWGLVGPVRNAFLVDKAGLVRIIFKNIDTSRFAEDVLVAAGVRVAPPSEPSVYDDAKAAVAEAQTKVREAISDAKAAVAGAVPAVKKAARTAVADFEKKPGVKKAVAEAKAAAGKASASAKKVVAEFEKKPAVKKAVREVKAAAKKASASAKKAVAEFERKPAVKKAVKAVKNAVARLQEKAGKAAPKKVAPKAAAKVAPKKGAAKKVAPKAAAKASPKAAAKKAAPPAPRAAKKPVKKAAPGRKR